MLINSKKTITSLEEQKSDMDNRLTVYKNELRSMNTKLEQAIDNFKNMATNHRKISIEYAALKASNKETAKQVKSACDLLYAKQKLDLETKYNKEISDHKGTNQQLEALQAAFNKQAEELSEVKEELKKAGKNLTEAVQERTTMSLEKDGLSNQV